MKKKRVDRRKIMGIWNPRSIRFKMVFYSMLCVISVSTCGYLYLFSYLNGIIVEKADKINNIYMENLTVQLEEPFQALFNTGINCANHYDVMKAMKIQEVKTVEDKKVLLQAQNVMNDLLSTTKMKKYVNKILVFNQQGVVVQAVGNHMAYLEDVEQIVEKKLDRNQEETNKFGVFTLGESITPYAKDSFSVLFKVSSFSDRKENGYLYMEVDSSIIKDILVAHSPLNYTVVRNEKDQDNWITDNMNESLLIKLMEESDKEAIVFDKARYKVHKKAIDGTNVSLYNFIDITELSMKENEMLYTLIVVLVLSAVITCAIIIMVSRWVTRPISRLSRRIQKIAENDFSYDPEIERTQDEIGEIGRLVNEMVQSVSNLMNEIIRKNEEQNKIEMALLQAQVNPHFLYNTLDSIHWMAVIQKAPGISNITRSLSNLLKNMAKGVSDKILLEDELSLLKDYITIQSIRYAETFEYKNDIEEAFLQYRIVKMTLQPVVENAIFHGIEPSGRIGTIRISAREDETYLYIDVEDNGVGMNEEQVQHLLADKKQVGRNTMSGIGVSNVNRRLKLIYGKACGLFVESEVDHYTKITVKIRKERDECIKSY
ncbi:sensor histidine kinase [Niameybacter massiliensis]|uniref:sensor histidine kinase n=1 Tax=Niameybacter massiliensis TaxID=1658108 RepID=UPI0006B4B4A6|nr:sensor histidine kinase [Niameybacter massiliensis]